MKILIYLLLLSAPLIVYPFSIDSFQIKTLLITMTGLLCLGKIRSFKPDIACLYFGWCLLSFLWCGYPLGHPAIELLQLIAYFGIYIWARDNIKSENIGKVILLAAAITAGYNFYLMGFKPIPTAQGTSFVNPNIYAGWLVLVLPVVLAEALSGKLKYKIVNWLIFGFGLVALYFTGCRSAMLGLVAALAAFSAFKWGKKGVAIVVVIIGLFGAIWHPGNIALLDPIRTRFWNGALDLIQSQPWTGYGIGSFRVMYPRFKYQSVNFEDSGNTHLLGNSHNWSFQMISEIGIIGLGIFLLMLWRILKRADDQDLVLIAMIAAVFGSLIDGFYNVALQYSVCGLMFWLYLGILSGSGKEEEHALWRYDLPFLDW